MTEDLLKTLDGYLFCDHHRRCGKLEPVVPHPNQKVARYESSVRNIISVPDGHCCTSCHEDADLFDYDLSEVDLPDGTVGMVCCDLARWFARNG